MSSARSSMLYFVGNAIIQNCEKVCEGKMTEFNFSVCPICGKKFKKHYSQICCSDKCKKERKRQLEKKRNKEYGKEYFADATRKYTHNNKEKIRIKERRDYHKDKTKALVRARTRNSNEKTGICFDCKKHTKTGFHHLSYEPNVFIELCRKCHNKRHGRNYYGR